MIKYTTLTDYVNNQIERFDIPDNEKNRNKIRIKCTRTLEKLGYWNSAKKQIIGRNETRLFTDAQLNHLTQEIEPYLLKQGNIDTEEIKTYRREARDYIDKELNLTQTDTEKSYLNEQYTAPTVTKREAMEVMITALYELFFEPLDIKRWNQDKATIHYANLEDLEDIDCILATKRLRNPVESYTKPKN